MSKKTCLKQNLDVNTCIYVSFCSSGTCATISACYFSCITYSLYTFEGKGDVSLSLWWLPDNYCLPGSVMTLCLQNVNHQRASSYGRYSSKAVASTLLEHYITITTYQPLQWISAVRKHIVLQFKLLILCQQNRGVLSHVNAVLCSLKSQSSAGCQALMAKGSRIDFANELFRPISTGPSGGFSVATEDSHLRENQE